MAGDLVLTAIRERIPFIIRMAGGREYTVTDPHQIMVGKTYVGLIQENDQPAILPLITATGLQYLVKQ